MEKMNLSDIFKIEIDEDMKPNELLLKFPKGQEHKNIRIVNIGTEEDEETKGAK